VLIVDNGSVRPEAHIALRKLATRLQQVLGDYVLVKACSARHSDKIAASSMPDGKAPSLLRQTLRELLAPFAGRTEAVSSGSSLSDDTDLVLEEQSTPIAVILPLFFGPSKTVTEFLP